MQHAKINMQNHSAKFQLVTPCASKEPRLRICFFATLTCHFDF